MAKRNSYREFESLMTKVILVDAAVFVGYLIFARLDIAALKVITAIISIAGSLLSLAWLFLTGELTRRRSFWMVTGFVCVILCVVVSLLLGYPCPSVIR